MQSDHFGCVRNTIRLRSGRYLNLADPQPDQFTFHDIAGALSKICRFGGQVSRFYSVAEHSVHCWRQSVDDGQPLAVQAAVLAHDFAEFGVGDMCKPLKVMLPSYSEVEADVELAVSRKFGIDFARYEEIIREIDHAMLICERRALFSADGVLWAGESDVRSLAVRVQCWRPDEAEEAIVNAAEAVGLAG